jgi:hypothetical protein
VVALPAALALGFCFSIAPVVARSIRSLTTPPRLQARVFATQATIAHAAVVAAVLLAGVSTQLAGPRATLVGLGVGGLVLLVATRRLGRWRSVAPTGEPGTGSG